MSRQHGTAGHKHRGKIQPGRRHQQARHILITVGNHHQSVKLVSNGHTFGGIRNQIPGHQGVLHADMTHGDAVTDSNGREHHGYTARFRHSQLHGIHDLVNVHVTGHNLIVRTDDAHHGFLHLLLGKTQSVKKTSGRSLLHAGPGVVACHHIPFLLI